MRQIAKIKMAELRAQDSISSELRRLINDSIQILEQSSSNEAIQFRLDWLVNIVACYIDQIPAGEAVLSLGSKARALSGEHDRRSSSSGFCEAINVVLNGRRGGTV